MATPSTKANLSVYSSAVSGDIQEVSMEDDSTTSVPNQVAYTQPQGGYLDSTLSQQQNNFGDPNFASNPQNWDPQTQQQYYAYYQYYYNVMYGGYGAATGGASQGVATPSTMLGPSSSASNYQMPSFSGFSTPNSGIMTPSSMIRTPSSMAQSAQNRSKATQSTPSPYNTSAYTSVKPTYASAALGMTTSTNTWGNNFVKSGTVDSSSLTRNPAYTSVRPPEQSISQLTLPQTTPQKKFMDFADTMGDFTAKKAPTSGSQWPPELKAYIRRCYAPCTGEKERKVVEATLMDRIATAVKDNVVWSYDWDNEPIITAEMALASSKPASAASMIRDLPGPSVLPTPTPPITPAANKNPSSEAQKKRKTGFEPLPGTNVTFTTTFDSQKKRQQRFLPTQNITKTVQEENDLEWNKFSVKGTCQNLEKPFFRLTSAPDPSTIRPEPVLKEALKNVKTKWKANQDYLYCWEQLKSIRQDLTVQGIKNSFTVEVYEYHARLALENDDIGEFNQCQTRLQELYYFNKISGNENEFLAYRLLYCSCRTHDQAELVKIISFIGKRNAKSPEIDHALKVRQAAALNNYKLFLDLWKKAPKCGYFIMQKKVNSMRNQALLTMSKSYRPDIPVDFVQATLGFDSIEECQEYLKSHGGVLTNQEQTWDTKSSNMF